MDLREELDLLQSINEALNPWASLDYGAFNKEELAMILVYVEKKKRGEMLVEEEKEILRQVAKKIKDQHIL